ncbi:BRICHOS domain-containing protein 5 [Lampris incognitus]|uniref:BRICHOS domain-containing protein 5 n=1 Tax=Lampris incognitus TaxID=2546036 RepID=UPI0024B4B468|nr:BRICHOS domain-containing protein 5 [Lampris incognitus]
MVRCWRPSQSASEEVQCKDGGSAASPKFPHKAFWVILSASLLLVIVVLGVTGHLGLPKTEFPIVRTTVPDQTGALVNQSALVDKENNLVTFSVTSQANHTATVVFDNNKGLICYKPVDQDSCFLQKMEKSDYENVYSLLHQPTPKRSQFLLSGNETLWQTEFLGVLADSQVDSSTLEEPFRTLCQDGSVHWTRRVDGPGKQRLVYFCIDICFPTNICVSVCFYYLPE